MNGDLTFLSLYRVNGGLFRKHEVPPTRDNAERLRMMRARLVPVVGNGYFNFPARTGINFSADIPEPGVPIEEFMRRWHSEKL